ncbi:MAG TPA: helix-turn-helix transcriptional regulator [Halanaerobiales bacterium]|nr:helix-turn-helix transcriptional regulator [Halanaerobiales bacterium]
MNNLKALRRVIKITQAQLGEEINLGQRDISKIETERREPTPEEIKRISRYFKVDAQLIFPGIIKKAEAVKANKKCRVENIRIFDDGKGDLHWYIAIKLKNLSKFLVKFEEFTDNTFIRIFNLRLNLADLVYKDLFNKSLVEIDISTSFHRYKNIMSDFIKQKLDYDKKSTLDKDSVTSLFDVIDKGRERFEQ